MKRLILMVLFTVSSLVAYDYGYNNNNDDSNYEGSSGTKYQYDLSDPSDKLDYSIDLDAQMRDSLSVDPSRTLDQGLGQYGGGIYDD